MKNITKNSKYYSGMNSILKVSQCDTAIWIFFKKKTIFLGRVRKMVYFPAFLFIIVAMLYAGLVEATTTANFLRYHDAKKLA
ncbi:hypothetical protein [Desulforhopalus singaporensis]|uniref:hypothetical protein n=1 Tax=Desulforhopalus singaporensis TaxID=91360 RepID=UPI00115FE4A2|nr:hypothetical protein [Desulforhopalus singaporensis]